MPRATSIVLGICALYGFAGGCAQFSESNVEWIRTCTGGAFDQKEASKLNSQALAHIHDAKLDKAHQLLLKAVGADATFGPARNNLGNVCFAQRKLYDAASHFQQAIEQMPESIEPVNNLGLVYESADRLNEAIEYYQQAFAMAPTNAEVIGNLVRAKMKRGDHFSEIEPLLRDLILYDSRCCWVDWAREHLAMAYKRVDAHLPTYYPSDAGPTNVSVNQQNAAYPPSHYPSGAPIQQFENSLNLQGNAEDLPLDIPVIEPPVTSPNGVSPSPQPSNLPEPVPPVPSSSPFNPELIDPNVNLRTGWPGHRSIARLAEPQVPGTGTLIQRTPPVMPATFQSPLYSR